MKKFNVTGLCMPNKHYMVDISEKLDKVFAMIENDEYFTINRARQYGKTTTINSIYEKLKEKYIVLSTSFEGIGDDIFSGEQEFCRKIFKIFAMEIKYETPEMGVELENIGRNLKTLDEVSDAITKFVRDVDKEVILIIDEVDKNSNNQLFLSFLGTLRNKYLIRKDRKDITFKSVILDSVYDIKNLKLKVRVDGEETYNLGNPEINLGIMFGLLGKSSSNVVVNNQIFETLLSNYFISKNETSEHQNKPSGILKEDVVRAGKFDMQHCLEKFAEYYFEIYSHNNLNFLEKHGRLLFLSYIKPLINGQGFYHIESETRNQRRMDLVVDFGCDQFIIELKRWKGEVYKVSAYEQLLQYMDSKNAKTGYLLTFDFRKCENKTGKAEWIEINGRRIFDVVV